MYVGMNESYEPLCSAPALSDSGGAQLSVGRARGRKRARPADTGRLEAGKLHANPSRLSRFARARPIFVRIGVVVRRRSPQPPRPMEQSDQPLELAAVLTDRYRIERQLGAGGMATVYLAHDLKLDREVALKVLRPELGAVLGSERFLAEVKITARLDHPHILTLIDSGSAGGLLYYVLPSVRGES